MKKISLGIGEIGVSSNPDETLEIIGLGSCIGVVIFASDFQIVSMAHVALPDSSINKSGSIGRGSGYFGDQAIGALLQLMQKNGMSPYCRLFAKIAGGASVMDPKGVFSIGKRNYDSVVCCLKQKQIEIQSEDCGGNYGRTIRAKAGSYKVEVISTGKGRWEI